MFVFKSMQWILSILTIIALPSLCQARKQKGSKMSFKAPVLDEEGQWSSHVPSTLTCEGCKAITHMITVKLWRFHQTQYPQNKMKPESEVITAVEKICRSDVFNGYGVKNVNGATKLSGPGLKAEGAAGMIMGGGRWPTRLAHRCSELMGEFDEYDIYEMIVKSKGKEKRLYDLFCMTERTRKLNSCGGGNDALLEPGNWMDGKGKSYTVEEKDDDDDDDDDYDDDEEDGYEGDESDEEHIDDEL